MAQTVKNLSAMQGTSVRSLGREDPLEKGMATQVLLPGKSHGQRSLAEAIMHIYISILPLLLWSKAWGTVHLKCHRSLYSSSPRAGEISCTTSPQLKIGRKVHFPWNLCSISLHQVKQNQNPQSLVGLETYQITLLYPPSTARYVKM